MLVKEFEVFVDDISNWYIRTNRRRFWKTGDEKDKMTAYWVLYYALNTATLVMSPVIPFMTEHIWQNFTRKVMPSSPISVHLCDWPKPIEGFEDDGIVEKTAVSREIIATAMRLRNEQQLKKIHDRSSPIRLYTAYALNHCLLYTSPSPRDCS